MKLILLFQMWGAIATFFGQLFTMYLSWKMIKFAKKYGKPWANAFKVFFVIMFLCLIRRGMAIYWGFGFDGMMGKILSWTDHVVLSFLQTVGYIIFLLILVKWWKDFFS